MLKNSGATLSDFLKEADKHHLSCRKFKKISSFQNGKAQSDRNGEVIPTRYKLSIKQISCLHPWLMLRNVFFTRSGFELPRGSKWIVTWNVSIHKIDKRGKFCGINKQIVTLQTHDPYIYLFYGELSIVSQIWNFYKKKKTLGTISCFTWFSHFLFKVER